VWGLIAPGARSGLRAEMRARSGWTPGPPFWWASSLKGPFDLVLANPPYVPEGAELALCVRAFEPAGALFAGADGLAAYRAILPDLPRLLAPAGVAIVEIDPGHAAAVTALGMHVGLAARAFSDLAGRTRAIALFDASETERFGLGKSPPTH
jgi:release factor glutamine methyltransferase